MGHEHIHRRSRAGGGCHVIRLSRTGVARASSLSIRRAVEVLRRVV